jgi:alpha-tubulin suppressor-like RCC1 family protein
LRCWGFASDGQLGQGNGVFLGDDEDPAGVSPIDAGGEVLQVATGSAHTCALLADGALRCWGRAAFGQLGQANTESIGDDELPREVPPIDVGGGVVTQFSTAGDQTCVRVETGALRCWGSNQFGQLGYGNTDNLGDDEFPVVAGEVSVF